jgi:uncharacterized protein (DUF2147 family)
VVLCFPLSETNSKTNNIAAEVIGLWTLPGGTRVNVSTCVEDELCAKIVSLKEPNYLSDKFGRVGTQKLDHMNPDTTLRSRPLIGISVASGLAPKGKDKWAGGQCYDPDKGKT